MVLKIKNKDIDVLFVTDLYRDGIFLQMITVVIIFICIVAYNFGWIWLLLNIIVFISSLNYSFIFIDTKNQFLKVYNFFIITLFMKISFKYASFLIHEHQPFNNEIIFYLNEEKGNYYSFHETLCFDTEPLEISNKEDDQCITITTGKQNLKIISYITDIISTQ